MSFSSMKFNNQFLIISLSMVGFVGFYWLAVMAPLSSPVAIVPVPAKASFEQSLKADLLRSDNLLSRSLSEAALDPRANKPVPAVLEGVGDDFNLSADSKGNLDVSAELVLAFEHFYSAIGQDDLQTIHARIAKMLNTRLPPKAAGQAWGLYQKYWQWKQSIASLNADSGNLKSEQNLSAKRIEEYFSARESMQYNIFGATTASQLFATERMSNNYNLERFRILNDKNMSAIQQQRSLDALVQQLPVAQQEMIRSNQVVDRVSTNTMTMKNNGASSAQLMSEWQKDLGSEGAARMQALDTEENAWSDKYKDYKAKLDFYKSQGLVGNELQQKQQELRHMMFDASEQARAQAWDESRT